MDSVKQQKLEQDYNAQLARKILRLGGIVVESLKFGVGFYVGFMDGQGTPIDSTIKYTSLAAPSVFLSRVFPLVFAYGTQKLAKHSLENRSSYHEKIPEGIDNPIRELQEQMEKVAYTKIPSKYLKLVAKSVGTTALKTGIGYTVGYCLAKLL